MSLLVEFRACSKVLHKLVRIFKTVPQRVERYSNKSVYVCVLDVQTFVMIRFAAIVIYFACVGQKFCQLRFTWRRQMRRQQQILVCVCIIVHVLL